MKAIELAAARVAKRYARRFRWADEDDLRQEAWIACLAAMRAYDPARGSVEGYLYRVAERACMTASARLRPRGPCVLEEEQAQQLAPGPSAGVVVETARWSDQVRERLRALTDDVSGPVLVHGMSYANVASMLCGWRPQRVTKRHFAKCRRRVKAAVGKARARIARDPALRRLWTERP